MLRPVLEAFALRLVSSAGQREDDVQVVVLTNVTPFLCRRLRSSQVATGPLEAAEAASDEPLEAQRGRSRRYVAAAIDFTPSCRVGFISQAATPASEGRSPLRSRVRHVRRRPPADLPPADGRSRKQLNTQKLTQPHTSAGRKDGHLLRLRQGKGRCGRDLQARREGASLGHRPRQAASGPLVRGPLARQPLRAVRARRPCDLRRRLILPPSAASNPLTFVLLGLRRPRPPAAGAREGVHLAPGRRRLRVVLRDGRQQDDRALRQDRYPRQQRVWATSSSA